MFKKNGVDKLHRIIVSNMKYILLIVAITIYLVSLIGAKLDYLSFKEIIINHFKCFRGKKDNRLRILPILNYTFVPILLGCSAGLYKNINSDILDNITIVISILTAMLFTMLSTVIEMKAKIKNNKEYYNTEYEIAKLTIVETYYAVMYEILIITILLIVCFFCTYTGKYNIVFSCIIYSLSFVMVSNLFMVIKRIFRIIETDINK